MTVAEIIKEVRWCIDEESINTSDMADVIDEKDDTFMDNIIKAKIPDALHWIAITASSSSVLSGSTNTTETDKETSGSTSATETKEMKVEAFEGSKTIGVVTIPDGISVFNVNRVRAYGWYKAVVPVEDTDDAALEMFDDVSQGTKDRPLAAIMRETPLKILIQPKPSTGVVTVSYVGVPTSTTTDESGTEEVEISDTFKSSFLYYLAYLLLSAYDDTKAEKMYTIAMQQLGVSSK